MTKAKNKLAAADKANPLKVIGNALTLHAQGEDERKNAIARAVTSTSLNSARIVVSYNASNTVDLKAVMDVLAVHQEQIKAGDMSQAENMLINQAVALQSMFVDLALQAKAQGGLSQRESMTALALKTQSACRATLQTLGDLRFPRQATFVRQTNIANGPQQVINNMDGGLSPALKNKKLKSKLIEGTNNGNTHLDLGATSAAAGIDPVLATVEAINRPDKR